MQEWLSQMGCVLYTPRPLQMPAPAPSFAEAAHGSTNPAMSLEQMEPSRELLQRLIAGNHAVALNLLGTLGETPDYIVSAQALAFVFTLRGDKNWKKAPTSGGANKVSPLAVRVYELLAEHGALNTRDLIVHAGREVTEAAVLRALGELWSQLRVFPQPQADGAQTLWELASARFTRQLKAGSNAGVPTALSALISLYLGAVIAATAEEIEIFLSPLAPRSRIREVVHGLMTTRQLEERVVEGKTLMHLVSGLPAFAPQFVEAKPKSDRPDVNPEDLRSETETPAPGFTPRIAKFAPRAGAAGKSFGKPAGKSFGDRKPFGDKKPFGKPDRERRPFSGSREGGAARPPRRDFGGKPGFGDKKPFAPRSGSSDRPPRRDFGGKPSFGEKKSFGDRKPFAEKKSFGGTRPSPRRDFGGKPDFTKPWEEEKKSRPRPDARAGFDAAAEGGATGGHATPRYPRFDDRKPGAPPRREYKPRAAGGDSRPPAVRGKGRDFGGKPGFGAKKPFTPRDGARPYKPRSADGDARPPRFDRVAGEKKSFSPGGLKKFGAKSFGEKKSFGPKNFADGEARGPKQFGEAKKFERKGPGARTGAPKKFGGASKAGGGKKFGAGPSKFGAKKKYDSGKGKPRPQGAPRKKKDDAE